MAPDNAHAEMKVVSRLYFVPLSDGHDALPSPPHPLAECVSVLVWPTVGGNAFRVLWRVPAAMLD